jgi:ribose 5-phosphate isomerase B
MKIFIGSDHAGFELKKNLILHIHSLGHSPVDKGAYAFVIDDDYPDYVIPVALEVSKSPNSRGIVIGGSGQGEAMVANKFRHIRAVVFNGQYVSQGKDVPNEMILSREHNDSNVLSLGARFITLEEAKEAVDLWLLTPFTDDDRHSRRIKKIDELERKNFKTTP